MLVSEPSGTKNLPQQESSGPVPDAIDGRRCRNTDIRVTRPTPPLPTGPFRVITADPPWRYSFSPSKKRSIERHYPTMDTAAIMALPVQEIAAEDSLLYLWATAPKLPEAMAVMEAWHFKYVCQWVWHKIGTLGTGWHSRVDHELVLIGKRGKPPVGLPGDRRSSVFTIRRGRHSEKPEAVYEQIDRLHPECTKIELFARKSTRHHWSFWGLEVESRRAMCEVRPRALDMAAD